MSEITRFAPDMDGEMETDESGQWVQFGEIAARLAAAEQMAQALRDMVYGIGSAKESKAALAAWEQSK